MIRWWLQGRGVGGYKAECVVMIPWGGDRVMMNDGGHVVLGQACGFVLMVERLMVMGTMVACSGVTGRCMIVGHDGGDGGQWQGGVGVMVAVVMVRGSDGAGCMAMG